MKRTGELIRELQDAVHDQQREIKKLRGLIYDRTRIRYGPPIMGGPLLVVKAIEVICKHLGVHFDYIYPDNTQAGWQLTVPSDDNETKE